MATRRVEFSDLNQVQMALEQSAQADKTRSILLLFWGAIMAKCFAAEWAVQSYAMPFDSLYIWIPTLLFGSVCTLVYSYTRLGGITLKPMTGSYVASVWFSCGIAAVLIGVAGLQLKVIDGRHIPGLLAVLMGVGCYTTSIVERTPLNRYLALGWWCGAMLLFAINNIDSILWFAGLIVLLQMLPTTLRIFGKRRKKAANNSI